jgi:hypothetical protein
MLVSEKKLSAADGVLLWPADRGLCFQSAGAFQRLGARLLGVRSAKSSSAPASPLPITLYDWNAGASASELFGPSPAFRTLIWAPHPALSWNESPDTSEIAPILQAVQYAQERVPEIHPIFVLPQRSSVALLRQLRALSPRATILLSPLAFGFRDEALFDHSLAVLKTKPGLLEKHSTDTRMTQPLRAVSFSDLAAHLVVTPHNEQLIGKNVWIQGAEWNLSDWLRDFGKAFRPKVGRLERLASRLSFEEALPSPLIDRILAPFSPPTGDESSQNDFVVHADHEVFPSPAPQLTRSLEQHSRAFERYPELELVFTPGRSL